MKKIDTEEIIRRAIEIHGDRYDYAKCEYSGADRKVIIKCQIHGEFDQVVSSHLAGHGCKRCPNSKNLADFLEDATRVHGNKYDYSLVVYINSGVKVKIRCKRHGEFLQNPNSHISGYGCKKCANELLSLGRETFILKAKLIHGDKFDYSKIHYINNNTKIEVICQKHGSFMQIPSNHLSGQSCPMCVADTRKKMGKDRFIKLACVVHGNKYDYSDVNYVGSKHKVSINCKFHGLFQQEPRHHLRGVGCPKCIHIVSKPESEWLDLIGVPNDPQHRQVKLLPNKNFRVDGFIPKNNTVYEFYGDFSHGNPLIYSMELFNTKYKTTFGDLYKDTLERENLLKMFGYKVVSIWQSEFFELKKFFKKLYKLFNFVKE